MENMAVDTDPKNGGGVFSGVTKGGDKISDILKI
jgi:hypothetical protein